MTNAGEDVEKREPYTLLAGMWSFLTKLTVEPPSDETLPLLGVYPKEIKLAYRRECCIFIFIAAVTQ